MALTPSTRSFVFNDGDWGRLRTILNKLGSDILPQLETDINVDLSNLVPYTGADQNVDLGSFNLTTTGSVTGGSLTTGTLSFSGNSITDSTGTITFDDENLTTTGLITAGNLNVDTLNLNANIISDSTGTISFADDNLITTGTLGAGNTTIGTLAAGNSVITGTLTASGNVGLGTTSTVEALTLDLTSSAGGDKLLCNMDGSETFQILNSGAGGSVRLQSSASMNLLAGSDRLFINDSSAVLRLEIDTLTSTTIIRTLVSNTDLEFTANDGGTAKTSFKIDASDNAQTIFVAQSTFQSGLNVGTDTSGKRIDDSSIGSVSTTLYIGDETIDTSVPSDRDLKNIIGDVTEEDISLNTLMLLKPTKFTFKPEVKDDSTTVHINLVAQDVESVFPDFVKNYERVITEAKYEVIEVLDEDGKFIKRQTQKIIKPEVIDIKKRIDYKGFITPIIVWQQQFKKKTRQYG